MKSWLREDENCRRVSYRYSLTPPAGISPETETVAQIRAELDPHFVPLWITRTFRYTTGREFDVTHIVLGRYRLYPPAGSRIVAGLPDGPNGEKIQLVEIVNGLSPEQQANDFIGWYVPLQDVLPNLREAMKTFREMRDFENFKDEDEAAERADREAKVTRTREMVERIRDIKRDNKNQLLEIFDKGKMLSLASRAEAKVRTTVSDTLKSLRKAATGGSPRSSNGARRSTAQPRGAGTLPAKA